MSGPADFTYRGFHVHFVDWLQEQAALATIEISVFQGGSGRSISFGETLLRRQISTLDWENLQREARALIDAQIDLAHRFVEAADKPPSTGPFR